MDRVLATEVDPENALVTCEVASVDQLDETVYRFALVYRVSDDTLGPGQTADGFDGASSGFPVAISDGSRVDDDVIGTEKRSVA